MSIEIIPSPQNIYSKPHLINIIVTITEYLKQMEKNTRYKRKDKLKNRTNELRAHSKIKYEWEVFCSSPLLTILKKNRKKHW